MSTYPWNTINLYPACMRKDNICRRGKAISLFVCHRRRRRRRWYENRQISRYRHLSKM